MPGRKYYLFDTCAAKYLYLKASKHNITVGLAYLVAQQALGEAFFYMPVFCITELFNVFAHMHYRDKDLSKADYDKHVDAFARHVRNRATFYPLPLTRYDNYSADRVLPIEHTTDTEYGIAGISAPTSTSKLKSALKAANRSQNLSEYRLSTFDVLVIAMGIELCKIHGPASVAIVTNDRRLSRIANACVAVKGPRGFFLEETPLAELQAFQNA